MMCGEGQRLVGLICEPCQNCAANGECHFGMDESDYFCESCPIDSYKLGSQCTQCYAGSATVLIAPILGVLCIFGSAIALYFIAIKSPAFKALLSRFKPNLRNQIRIKQLSTLFQVMKVVSSLNLSLPSWFISFFEALLLFTLPVSIEPACVSFISVPTSVNGALVFISGLGVSFTLRELYRIKGLRQVLPNKFFINAQIVSGVLFSTFGVVAITQTFKATEIQEQLILISSSSSPNEATALIIALMKELAMQLTFVALEVFFILMMFSRWGEHYAEIEREYSQLDEREKDATEDANYQLENMIPFCATFCQNYVPSQIDFEKKVFRMKVMCFMILQASGAGSTVTQLGECSSKGRVGCKGGPQITQMTTFSLFPVYSSVYLKKLWRS